MQDSNILVPSLWGSQVGLLDDCPSPRWGHYPAAARLSARRPASLLGQAPSAHAYKTHSWHGSRYALRSSGVRRSGQAGPHTTPEKKALFSVTADKLGCSLRATSSTPPVSHVSSTCPARPIALFGVPAQMHARQQAPEPRTLRGPLEAQMLATQRKYKSPAR